MTQDRPPSTHRADRSARMAAMADRLRRLRPRSRRDWALAAGVAAVVVAVVSVVVVLIGPSGGGTRIPPTPPSPLANTPNPTVAPSAAPVDAAETPTHAEPSPTRHSTDKFSCAKPPAAAFSTTPLKICIPAIDVDASVMNLGLNPDRTVQVPPLSEVGEAGWYRYSAQPGSVGPTVILGHIDSAQYGDGVFFRLGELHSGDTVRIVRGDGALATYRVDRVTEVPKTRFPTQSVYGPTSKPEIRLVTCGGQFDSATGNYLDNIITYGSLVSLRDA